MREYNQIYINGRWQTVEGERAQVFEAATGTPMATVPRADEAAVDAAVAAAKQAFVAWSQTSLEERLGYLKALFEQLQARSEDIAETVAREVGTPIKLSRNIQAGLPIAVTGSYLKILPEFPFTETVGNSEVQYAPVGVVGAVTPWNYPLHQIMLKVAPALGAGCTVVLKPAEVAPLTGFMLAEICDEIGLPAGVFNLVAGAGSTVGQRLITHPDVAMLSFTGSTDTGRRFYRAAAEDFKRLALELGGKSASVVLPDADLEAAVKGTLGNCYLNSGQTCTAYTRMLVPADRHDEACERAAAVAGSFTVGNPLDEKTRLGPLASANQVNTVREYIRIGRDEGATLVTGGEEPPEGLNGGYYVRPTVFGNVDPNARIAQEEIFGPVLTVIPYRDEAEAVAIANGTQYGLSGAVWSADIEHAKRVASQLRTGQVFINNAKFNPFAPFGGFGHSGLGREMGKWGLEEFLEVRSLQL